MDCPVCLTAKCRAWVTTECGHRFHQACVARCPLCRADRGGPVTRHADQLQEFLQCVDAMWISTEPESVIHQRFLQLLWDSRRLLLAESER